MKAIGITAEFNPLHLGHEYMLGEVKKTGGDAAVVLAMSGNYVQRGEPAIIDKWARTESALAAGADLVIEIPTLFCLGNAGQYAKAGVKLLEGAGCETIAFGSESGDVNILEYLAKILQNNREAISEEISALMQSGMNYPSARAGAYEKIRKEINETKGEDAANSLNPSDEDFEKGLEDELEILRGSNDILATEYLMNMSKADAMAIKRVGAGYSSAFEEGAEYQSATAIREMLARGEDVKEYVPASSYEILERSKLTFPRDWTEVLRYAAMNKDAAEIEDAPSGGEGLGNLLKEAVKECDSFDEIVMRVKSKRYTYTRISRLCIQTVLGITRDKYYMSEPSYIRVLGFTAKGREYLAELKRADACTLPIITNINKESDDLSDEAKALLELDIKGSDIYNNVTGRDVRLCSDHRMTPVILERKTAVHYEQRS